MPTTHRVLWAGAALLVGGALAAAAVAQTAVTTQPATPARVANPSRSQLEAMLRIGSDHWADHHMRSLEAESTRDQAIYLSAVQMVEMERRNRNVGRAVEPLKGILAKTTSRTLRNGLLRLLVAVSLETDDKKSAERYLQQIVDENLGQL
jgi:hypothetical protein